MEQEAPGQARARVELRQRALPAEARAASRTPTRYSAIAHAVEGTVVHGEERGRTIGFPTANLSDNVAGYLPVDGVYAGWLVDFGAEARRRWRTSRGEATRPTAYRTSLTRRPSTPAWPMQSPHRWPAAISIGTKPTFNEATGMTPNASSRTTAITADNSCWTCTAIRRAWNSQDSCARRSSSIPHDDLVGRAEAQRRGDQAPRRLRRIAITITIMTVVRLNADIFDRNVSASEKIVGVLRQN